MRELHDNEISSQAGITGQAGILSRELQLLKLRLKRHVVWLRSKWREGPPERYQGLAVTDAEVDRIFDEDDAWKERAAFFREDSEAASLTRLLEQEDAADDGVSTSLKLVQRMFMLSDFERDTLLLAAAVELDSGFERLYAYAQDDAGLLLPTPALARFLFCDNAEEALLDRSAFIPTAPLFRYRLIDWASPQQGSRGGLLSRPYRIDERILAFLAGSPVSDARIAPAVRALSSPLPLPGIWPELVTHLEARLSDFLEVEEPRGLRMIVNLHGKNVSEMRSVATAASQSLGIPLLQARLDDLLDTGLPLESGLALFFRESLLMSAAVYLELAPKPGNEADGGGGGGQVPEHVRGVQEGLSRRILQAARDYSVITFVASETSWPPASEDPASFNCLRTEVALPTMNFSGRRKLWEQGLSHMSNTKKSAHHETGLAEGILPDDLANRFQFTADQIRSALSRAEESASLQGRPVTSADIDDACRAMPVHGLGSLAQKVTSPFSWEDIVLPDDTLEQLKEITRQFRFREKVYGEWRFERKLDRGRGTCVLFSGPSGTGKTMAAGILANDLGLDLYRIDLSGVVSKYIGETEKNLRRVFDEGEKSQAILFFDEADALFGKRSEVKDSHDRYANIEINYLLQRMENYTGASILATNMRSSLDTAFMRRLRYIVEFPMPDTAYRETIWRKSFPPEAAIDGVDFRFLAKNFAMSGGNIMNVAVNAAFMAAADGGRIGMTHLVLAVKREYAKLGKLCLESEFGKYF